MHGFRPPSSSLRGFAPTSFRSFLVSRPRPFRSSRYNDTLINCPYSWPSSSHLLHTTVRSPISQRGTGTNTPSLDSSASNDPSVPPDAGNDVRDGAGQKFKVLFCGRDHFSCLVFEKLYRARDIWEELHVLSTPDMMVGRDKKELSVSPLKTLAESYELPIWTIPRGKKAFRHWKPPPPFSTSIDILEQPPTDHVLITASFGRIISTPFLSHFAPDRRLNVHPSLLPAYRGASPIQYALMNREKESGVCVIGMSKYRDGVDTGALWARETVPLVSQVQSEGGATQWMSFAEARDVLAMKGGYALLDVLRGMKDGTAESVPQADATNAPRAPLITLQDARIDFKTMSASVIEARYRAIGHQRPLTTVLPTPSKGPLKLQLSKIYLLQGGQDPPPSLSDKPGSAMIDKSISEDLLVRCADGGVLSVGWVKMEGRENMPALVWWGGVRSMWGLGKKGSVVLGEN